MYEKLISWLKANISKWFNRSVAIKEEKMKFLYDPIKGFNKTPPPDGVRFTQGFGQNLLDYSPLIGHNGWDIAAPLGTPIYAACDGWIVEQTSKETGYGLRITQRVEVNGQYFLLVYAHMQRLELDKDVPYNWFDKSIPVKAGQVIGYVNSTGRSTGNHLHFGVYEYLADGSKKYPNNGYGGAVDPQQYALNIDPPEIIKVKFKTQNYKGELRVIPEEFCATDEQDWKDICKVLNVDPNKIDETV